MSTILQTMRNDADHSVSQGQCTGDEGNECLCEALKLLQNDCDVDTMFKDITRLLTIKGDLVKSGEQTSISWSGEKILSNINDWQHAVWFNLYAMIVVMEGRALQDDIAVNYICDKYLLIDPTDKWLGLIRRTMCANVTLLQASALDRMLTFVLHKFTERQENCFHLDDSRLCKLLHLAGRSGKLMHMHDVVKLWRIKKHGSRLLAKLKRLGLDR